MARVNRRGSRWRGRREPRSVRPENGAHVLLVARVFSLRAAAVRPGKRTGSTMARTHTVVASPLGGLTVVAEGGALTGVNFEGHLRGPREDELGDRRDEGYEEVKALIFFWCCCCFV